MDHRSALTIDGHRTEDAHVGLCCPGRGSGFSSRLCLTRAWSFPWATILLPNSASSLPSPPHPKKPQHWLTAIHGLLVLHNGLQNAWHSDHESSWHWDPAPTTVGLSARSTHTASSREPYGTFVTPGAGSTSVLPRRGSIGWGPKSISFSNKRKQKTFDASDLDTEPWMIGMIENYGNGWFKKMFNLFKLCNNQGPWWTLDDAIGFSTSNKQYHGWDGIHWPSAR